MKHPKTCKIFAEDRFIGHLKGQGREVCFHVETVAQLSARSGSVAGEERRSRRTMLLHNAQEFDDDLRAWSDQDLSLPGLLGVVDGIERIVEDTCFDHLGGRGMRFSNRLEMRYLLRWAVSPKPRAQRVPSCKVSSAHCRKR